MVKVTVSQSVGALGGKLHQPQKTSAGLSCCCCGVLPIRLKRRNVYLTKNLAPLLFPQRAAGVSLHKSDLGNR